MIIVVAEHRDGRLNRATWEALAASQAVADGTPVAVAVLGPAGDAPAELARADVAEVLVVDDPQLATYTPDGFVKALELLLDGRSPTFVFMPHTYQTRDFAPLLAVRLGTPLVTDVTGITGAGSDARFVRPMFQGKLMATVRPRGNPPWLITCQVGAFRADSVRMGGAARVTPVVLELDAEAIRQRPEGPFQEAKPTVDLARAEYIVAVGRGIGSQEKIAVADRLAQALGAEVAASRPICDSGWLPMDRQVGSSGQTVTPKLYVALGISGAIQHLVGMKGSRTIVAVNKDAEAPIFEVADYGIVGDLFEIVPAIVAELEKG